MKNLVNRPMFLAALLVIPLWIIFSNFVVAAAVALLVSFFAAMVNSLYVLKRSEPPAQEPQKGKDGKKAYDQ